MGGIYWPHSNDFNVKINKIIYSYFYLFIFLFSFLLTHSLIHHLETVQNSKKLQTTTEMWLLKDFKIQIV